MADAFGRMVLDYHRGAYDGSGRYRSYDGATRDAHPEWYFGDSFPAETDAALERVLGVDGLVLDAGCGTGSKTLALQRDDAEVLAVDVSPGALAVATDRGVDWIARADLRSLPAVADCVFLSGTQFGIGGTVDSFRSTLRALAETTPEDGRVVGDLKDPSGVADSRLAGRDELRSYDPGRGVGHRRMRLEYRDLEGPWLDLLCPTPDAARRAVAETEWRVAEVVEGEGPRYYLVLDR